jgi:hypothetical protein
MGQTDKSETEVLIRADPVRYENGDIMATRYYEVASVDVQDLSTGAVETVRVEDFAARGWVEEENMNGWGHDFYKIDQDLDGDKVNDIKVIEARFTPRFGGVDRVWTPEGTDYHPYHDLFNAGPRTHEEWKYVDW